MIRSNKVYTQAESPAGSSQSKSGVGRSMICPEMTTVMIKLPTMIGIRPRTTPQKAGCDRTHKQIQNDIELRGEGEVNCQILVRQGHKAKSKRVEDFISVFSFKSLFLCKRLEVIICKLSKNNSLMISIHLIVGNRETNSPWNHICKVTFIHRKYIKHLCRVIINFKLLLNQQRFYSNLENSRTCKHLEPSILWLPI
ncbi:hypothetical protein FGO68_gene15924 [Halteria grandinella]|uniref:Uncharacterized protein n=1 Tax=Halteria grandinella TaxID=5974 RepID=A0A8J8NGL3_HALGN|nr:hypothetical protein FGO68_gene15924 [Halteria grandinella]